MLQLRPAECPHPVPPQPVSPLVLSDKLLTLAETADRAGYQRAAEDLLQLAFRMLDEPSPN
jgi:hypothetical protein